MDSLAQACVNANSEENKVVTCFGPTEIYFPNVRFLRDHVETGHGVAEPDTGAAGEPRSGDAECPIDLSISHNWASDKNQQVTTLAAQDHLDQVARALLPLRAVRAEALAATAAKRRRMAQLGLATIESAGKWHETREKALGVFLVKRLGYCDQATMDLAHRETGELLEDYGIGCHQKICPTCAGRKAGRLQRRLAKVLPTMATQLAEKGLEPWLLTLTVRHEGNPAATVLGLRTAWPKFRRKLWKIGLASPAYFRTEECTPGAPGGDGHVHWHIVIFWPSFVPFGEVRSAWHHALGWTPERRADGLISCGCSSEAPCARHAPGNVDLQNRRTGESSTEAVARYATKALEATAVFAYATKSEETKAGKGLSSMAPAMVAAYIDACYMQRWVSASKDFWQQEKVDWVFDFEAGKFIAPPSAYGVESLDGLEQAPRGERGWWRQVVA